MKNSLIVAALILTLAFSGTAQDSNKRSAPLPDELTRITRIAFGSCADEELAQPIWKTIAGENPELFLFIGDNVYADINRDQWVNEPDLKALQFSYRTLDARADFNAFRKAVPILAGWDDHDFGVNDGGRDFPLKAEAKKLMLDFFDVPKKAAVRKRDGVYYSKIYGPEFQRVQIIMLDTRWFRSDLTVTDEKNAVGKERYLPSKDPKQTMLGEKQWKWLADQLKKPAEVRLLVSGIQVESDAHGWEAWRTMPLERARLYNLINSSGAEGIVMLSGDRHVGGFYRIEGKTGYPLYEFTSSSLNKSFARGTVITENGPNQLGHLFGPENYGMLTLDWADRILSMELKDIGGKTVRAVTISLDDLTHRVAK